MNDSFRTNAFVRYPPETIACACIYLAARALQIVLPKSPPWFQIFGATEEEIQDICLSILRLYARPKVGGPAHPNSIHTDFTALEVFPFLTLQYIAPLCCKVSKSVMVY